MTRLIDADKLHTLFDNNCVGDCNVCNFYTSVHYVIHNKDCKGHSFCGLIDKAPTVEERPQGEWIEHQDYYDDTYYTCSHCGEDWITIEGKPTDNLMNYCPFCGADMREADNGS